MQWNKTSIRSAYSLLIIGVLIISACGEKNGKTAVDLNHRTKDPHQQEKAAKPAIGKIRFGFDLRASPQEDARQYLPFLKFLEEVTGYDIELKFTAKGKNIAQELGLGNIQFAAIGATSYIKSHERYGSIILVRGVNTVGKAEYQSMIVVHPNSPLTSIADLRGKRFAFGDQDSTQGHLIPRIMLGEFGLGLEDFVYYEYTGSHRNCANAAASSKFDACGMQDTMAKDLAKQGQLRILHTSKYYPSSGIAANKDVEPEVTSKVKQALLDFEPEGHHRQGLYHWDKTEMPKGFKDANPQDYDDLRQWMITFGMLLPAKNTPK